MKANVDLPVFCLLAEKAVMPSPLSDEAVKREEERILNFEKGAPDASKGASNKNDHTSSGLANAFPKMDLNANSMLLTKVNDNAQKHSERKHKSIPKGPLSEISSTSNSSKHFQAVVAEDKSLGTSTRRHYRSRGSNRFTGKSKKHAHEVSDDTMIPSMVASFAGDENYLNAMQYDHQVAFNSAGSNTFSSTSKDSIIGHSVGNWGNRRFKGDFNRSVRSACDKRGGVFKELEYEIESIYNPPFVKHLADQVYKLSTSPPWKEKLKPKVELWEHLEILIEETKNQVLKLTEDVTDATKEGYTSMLSKESRANLKSLQVSLGAHIHAQEDAMESVRSTVHKIMTGLIRASLEQVLPDFWLSRMLSDDASTNEIVNLIEEKLLVHFDITAITNVHGKRHKQWDKPMDIQYPMPLRPGLHFTPAMQSPHFFGAPPSHPTSSAGSSPSWSRPCRLRQRKEKVEMDLT